MTDTYRYTPHVGVDLLVAQLWALLNETGDLARLFEPDGTPMSDFFDTLGLHDTHYTFDSRGIWLLNWFEPMRHGALFNGWVRKDKRQNELTTSLVRDICAEAAGRYITLLGLTRHDNVIAFCEKIGFRRVARIPGLMAGYDTDLIMATADTIEASKLYDLARDVHAGA